MVLDYRPMCSLTYIPIIYLFNTNEIKTIVLVQTCLHAPLMVSVQGEFSVFHLFINALKMFRELTCLCRCWLSCVSASAHTLFREVLVGAPMIASNNKVWAFKIWLLAMCCIKALPMLWVNNPSMVSQTDVIPSSIDQNSHKDHLYV